MGTHTFGFFQNGPVHPFGQPIHLWRIRHSNFVFYLVFAQVLGKSTASVLSSPVCFQHTYSLATFSGHFRMEFLEHRQRVAFAGHKVHCTGYRVVIHKSYHVFLTRVGACSYRATYIRMHLLQSSA